ncbi:MAG: family 43 glycosylhydrolase [Butyrivibrio sp.]|nr:family 43 glycosylhydrolase [Butyrivibrio sp.]
MGNRQAVNPFLPGYEYIPDAEPHIVGDRVYIYGSHDKFNGLNFCLGDYICYSAPVDDLGNWRYEGIIFRKEQDPAAKPGRVLNGMAAPDMVQGPDGRFYLYYFIGGTGMISVAVCDEPGGSYEFYGYVHYADEVPIGKKGEPFMFDPGVFMDDNGRLYLYVGFGLKSNPIILGGHKPTLEGPLCYELDPADMLSVVHGPRHIGVPGELNSKGSGYEGHEFLEASSMRKFDGKYYYIYSSLQSHELCYAYSDHPDKDFKFGGVLVSNGDIGLDGREYGGKAEAAYMLRHAKNDTGNTHGSLIKIGDKYYVFYHRQTNRKQSSRQACAEEILFENGRFYQAEMTSCGLNGGPLSGKGVYPARICCNLYGKNGTRFLSMIKRPAVGVPYLTQTGPDYDPIEPEGKKSKDDIDAVKPPVQYVANVCDGTVVGYKHFDLKDSGAIAFRLRGQAQGILRVCAAEDGSHELGAVEIGVNSRKLRVFETFLSKDSIAEAYESIDGSLERGLPLFLRYEGKGSFDLVSFKLK